jgi:transcription elongation factor Elf1
MHLNVILYVRIPFEEQYLTCYKCNKQIPSTNTLTVSSQPVTANVCIDCSSKKRSRSRSFTLNDNNVFSQLADKLKHSFGNNQLLSPGNGVDRRKSMPSMNAAFSSSSQQLEPPSPVPSRPSSRASSFIEDVKQFLAPLSRKSSRNSLYQEYQSSQLPTPEGPKRKTSHNSLLEVMNICKPKQRLSPRHQEDEAWFQEDNEVNHIHQRQQQQYQDECPLENHTSIHIPLRRKQIKQIESRQDRMNVYSKFYLLDRL